MGEFVDLIINLSVYSVSFFFRVESFAMQL